MTALAANLFDRRFQDLVEIGRARLRPLAPEWTDHNAHDPGITLMELLAWVAEAQLYSVSRMRRDERAAYASLVGLTSAGTRGAEGSIWPDRTDPNTPIATFAHSVVISPDTDIHITGDTHLPFRPTHKVLLVPGRIARLASEDALGSATDLTSVNAKGDLPFLPFGDGAGRNRSLALTFVSRDSAGPFGRDRQRAKGALWAIGVVAAPAPAGVSMAADDEQAPSRSPLSAALLADGNRTPVPVVSDSTQGMLTTGVLLLDLDGIASAPAEFTLELRAPSGFDRPPRLLRIEPNAIPIRQGRVIDRELAVRTGLPNWSFELAEPGIRFNAGKEPVKVEVSEADGVSTWRRGRLDESGPDDRVYELDPALGRITFGNGFNGRIPPSDSQVFATYAVSDGADGNVGRNRKWSVAGFGGVFGVNLDPIAGGRAPLGWIDERREARRRTRAEHALVSASDFVEAARALPLLEVVRGWVVVPAADTPRTGVVRLVAMRSRPDDVEPDRIPETRQWLDAIRRRLLPRVPLGTRLEVVAPRYVEFSLRASLECAMGRKPAAVEAEVEKALRRRLALVALADGTAPREPGVLVTRRDVAAWILAVDGVRRIRSLDLVRADGRTVPGISVRDDGLPRWTASSIDVVRSAPGGGR